MNIDEAFEAKVGLVRDALKAFRCAIRSGIAKEAEQATALREVFGFVLRRR